MKSRLATMIAAFAVVIVANLCIFGQTGSISGTVVDSNGSVVPNATVEVKGQSGQDYRVSTNDSGNFRVPGVAVGVYTITVTNAGFKKSVINNVKVDIGTPATAAIVLEAGNISEVVEVTSGGEVLQTQTATVGTNITGRQITQTPISSRDALDLILRLPGVASVGAPRQSSINGLPKGSIQMTIDGVDVQDNVLRSSDGFFTFVRPRVDAIEEVVVSTASPGAESTGDGAVQVRFATKRGTNDYRGTVYWQNRNTALNAAYWYNNRDLIGGNPDKRDISKLNQPGFAVGGPIPYPHFGEGGPKIMSGKDRMFFFINYEEFRLPGSQTRTRTVLKPDVLNGQFGYITGGVTNFVNLYTIGGNGLGPTTIDPTISGVLNAIQSAATTANGTRAAITGDPNRETFTFTNPGSAQRKFFVLRLDGNITKNHSAEFVMNRQNFLPSIDFINNQDAPFPGGRSYGQGGVRKSWTWAVRSTLSQSIVNEARYAVSGGGTEFAQGCCADDFSSQNGMQLNLATPFGTTQYRAITAPSARTTPTYDWTDNLTWNKGNHTWTFGGQYKRVRTELSGNTCCPTVTFDLDQTRDATLWGAFNTTSMPGATTTQIDQARDFYAALVGRIVGYARTAVLTADGTYVPGGNALQILQQKTYGLYAQDTWRLHQTFNVTLGIRWQPRMGVTAESGNFGQLVGGSNSLYGKSCSSAAMFRPGAPTTCAIPATTGVSIGSNITPDDTNNWAPSIGAVWSPNFGDTGFLRTVFGQSGKSVFRGGWSRSFVREGLNVGLQLAAGNPGAGSINVGRTFTTTPALTPGTLLRTPGNPMLTPNQSQFTPNFPAAHTVNDQSFAALEDLKTGYVDSFNFGYQRELDKNTVVELRYVGNRGKGLERLRSVNEVSALENGIYPEYILAQQNVYANEAAFRAGDQNRRFCSGFVNPVTLACQVSSTNTNLVARTPTMAYFGAGTGTSPLPIALAYFSAQTATLTPGALNQAGSVTGVAALNPALYTSPLFGSATFTNPLNRLSPNVLTWANNLQADSARRQNAINAGLPENFIFVNPTNIAGAFILDNTGNTWYDSGVIEVRRRLSAGLRVQGSYTFSKAQTDMFAVSAIVNSSFSNRDFGLDLAKTVQPFDLTHNFKVDATYDLPFGRGRSFFSNAGRLVDTLIGGFSIFPVISWQSGSPIQIGNVQLVGMTVKELQKSVKVRKDAVIDGINVVAWLPDDIIINSRRAFSLDLSSVSGYSTTFGGPPSGRYLAPAGTGNCLGPRASGECGFNNLIIYGPTFFKFDLGITKRFTITERMNIELKANLLDALNHPNFKLGGFGGNTAGSGCCTATFGQLASGSAYRDNNTTNDPGGRVIDLQLRFNF